MIDNIFFNKKKDFLTLKEVLKITDGTLDKNKNYDLDKKIYGIATIDNATSDEITFLNSGSYAQKLITSKAGFCFMQEKYLVKKPQSMIAILHDNPYFAYATFLNNFYEIKKELDENLISTKAIIEKSAVIGKNTRVMHGAYIGHNVKIGDNCIIGVNSVINYNCQIGNNSVINSLVTISFAKIGDRALIHNGVKIGQDGFGFAHNQGVNHKILQLGIVVIGNDIEIGANTCIDRGAIENTVIGNGVKIDNLVQIAHNVIIGDGTVIAGCAALAGSCTIGRFVQIGGSSNIGGHITIGDGARIAGASGLMKDVEPMQVVAGSPSIPIKDWHRMNIKLMQLIKPKASE